MTEHNTRYIIDKIYAQLRDLEGSDNIRQALDRIDQNKSSLDELVALLEDIAQFYPDVYGSVPEAAAYVVHVRSVRTDGAT